MGVLSLRRQILMAQPHRETVVGTNGIATFDTDFKAPVKSVTIPFEPKQEGTGDPSPDNVRPISGWTGCEIRHFYQLFDENSETIERKYYSNNGRILDDDGITTTRIYTQYIPVSPNTMYTIHGDSDDLAYIRVVEFNSIKTFATRTLSSYIQNPSVTIITQSQTRYLRINPDTAVSNIFVYETNAETNTIFPITFTNPSTGNPLTVYGGTVTLNGDGSADVITTWAFVKPGTTEFGFSPQTTYQKTFNGILYGGAYAYTASNWHIGQIYSNGFCDKIKIGATSYINGDDANITLRGLASGSSVDVWVRADLLADMSDKYATNNSINAWLAEHDVTLVIRSRQSLHTYHFPNIGQLKSFLGENNVWSDLNGDPTVTFWKHG